MSGGSCTDRRQKGHLLRWSLARYLSGQVSCLSPSRNAFDLDCGTCSDEQQWAASSIFESMMQSIKEGSGSQARVHRTIVQSIPAAAPSRASARPTAHKAAPYWTAAVNTQVVNP